MPRTKFKDLITSRKKLILLISWVTEFATSTDMLNQFRGRSVTIKTLPEVPFKETRVETTRFLIGDIITAGIFLLFFPGFYVIVVGEAQ